MSRTTSLHQSGRYPPRHSRDGGLAPRQELALTLTQASIHLAQAGGRHSGAGSIGSPSPTQNDEVLQVAHEGVKPAHRQPLRSGEPGQFGLQDLACVTELFESDPQAVHLRGRARPLRANPHPLVKWLQEGQDRRGHGFRRLLAGHGLEKGLQPVEPLFQFAGAFGGQLGGQFTAEDLFLLRPELEQCVPLGGGIAQGGEPFPADVQVPEGTEIVEAPFQGFAEFAHTIGDTGRTYQFHQRQEATGLHPQLMNMLGRGAGRGAVPTFPMAAPQPGQRLGQEPCQRWMQANRHGVHPCLLPASIEAGPRFRLDDRAATAANRSARRPCHRFNLHRRDPFGSRARGGFRGGPGRPCRTADGGAVTPGHKRDRVKRSAACRGPP